MMIDAIIVGAGPAGMMAAIYLKRANKDIVILDKNSPGGRLKSTYQVDNYLGFGRVSADELVQKMVNHLKDLEIEETDGFVKKITRTPKGFTVQTELETYETKAVILATGTAPKHLGVKNEKALLARGVSYCAVCDGIFFENRDVVVIGGGDSALEESLYLAEIASSVVIIHDLPELTASQGIIKKVKQHPKIQIRLNTKVLEFIGSTELEAVKLQNKSTYLLEVFPTSGAFIYVGNQADTSFLTDSMNFDQSGYIEVNQEMSTNIPGIFACGDVTKKDYRFIVTAISDGAIAALSAVKYIDSL
ncbi:MAG: FAD-dependent oxidoreductase [Candidatus Izemoplasmatales bacterium]|nr:FAD-dependent oxidoreductase [Candidatus Izemoplasmatales bacterium]